MNALPRAHSLRARLSLWLAVQSFVGLGVVCLVVYLVTAHNLSERQVETLAQKEAIVRHLLSNIGEHAKESSQEHPLSDFLIGHEDFRLIVRTQDGDLVFPKAAPNPDSARRVSRVFAVQPTDDRSQTFNVNLSMDISSDAQHLNRLAITLAIAAVVGTFVISLGGMSIVSYGLAPVRRLAHQLNYLSADNLRPRLDGAGQPAELVPLVEQFNGLLGRLDLAYTQLEGFNADVSHELRTPLATLVASNELALRHPGNFDMEEVLSSNLEELHRLAGIINDMLFLSKADRGATARRSFVPSLAAVVERVAEYHEAALADADLRLKVSGDGTGHFDEPLLRRAVSNLIGNATQYAKPGTEVEVSIGVVSDTEVSLVVANQGETVSPEILGRIFDRFFRASASREHGQKNHGLGLAITSAIARMHGGRTTAASVNGKTEIGLVLVKTVA
ncbi:heavy metal sensor histidine kinase [Paracidovorax sp. MALMAid1276]|jgi:two-component system heavy metal sensor histidine kinase CusS|uniref:heavy metal sensor histidine kinase n=1 Tax=Paracidovorax sp. MALMAid1276 TaxID=3411631 RepID=UPI00076A7E9C|nr:heavy metal sensor histidine kinase [uncultured Acidovorax sp.]